MDRTKRLLKDKARLARRAAAMDLPNSGPLQIAFTPPTPLPIATPALAPRVSKTQAERRFDAMQAERSRHMDNQRQARYARIQHYAKDGWSY